MAKKRATMEIRAVFELEFDANIGEDDEVAIIDAIDVDLSSAMLISSKTQRMPGRPKLELLTVDF